MHFLQPDKYDLLESDFDLTDEDKEAKIRDLHGKLKDIMLRRLKKDVVKELPTKSERILRVEMSQMQVWWYKNILTRVRLCFIVHLPDGRLTRPVDLSRTMLP
jgi:chromodomain-helicase-DNA-binding protein 1